MVTCSNDFCNRDDDVVDGVKACVVEDVANVAATTAAANVRGRIMVSSSVGDEWELTGIASYS